MSVDSSINLRIVQSVSGVVVSPIKTLEILIANGWRLDRDGYVFYLQNEDYDWASETMDTESLIKILKKKEQDNERIGVFLTWENTEIGGELLLWSEKDTKQKNIHTPMSFCLSSNRKILSSDDGRFKITDVNWYLTRLLPAFNQGDTFVEYFTYEEHI